MHGRISLQIAVSLVLSLQHDIHHSYAFMSHVHGLLGEHARLLSGGATMLLRAPLPPHVARKTVSPLYNCPQARFNPPTLKTCLSTLVFTILGKKHAAAGGGSCV